MTPIKLDATNRVLEDILVIVGAPPVVTSPEALAILTRVTEGWAEGEEIDLYSGLGWMRFQQRIGVQRNLYMNERQLRRQLRELVDAGMLQGDPQRAIWWSEGADDDDEDDED
jgi:hypothetical protein